MIKSKIEDFSHDLIPFSVAYTSDLSKHLAFNDNVGVSKVSKWNMSHLVYVFRTNIS